jgi:radical SAM superfamily enzyme YgiQ (UPF0313 family)
MTVHLINPSHVSFGVGVITPRWLYVLAGATKEEYGQPVLTDETLEPFDPDILQKGDVVGIGIHTGNALRGYELGNMAQKRGARVIFGGIHASLFPEEALEIGGAHSVVKGDGDIIWNTVLEDCARGVTQRIYQGGTINGGDFAAARWDLLPKYRYMWASVQTVRGCPKHCSFCSVWRTDGQKPRTGEPEAIFNEILELRRRGFRFIALSDDNFYPVSLTDLETARRRGDPSRLHHLEELRAGRFELMQKLAQLPKDMVFYTQITMEAAEDPAFLQAMERARIRGALVGIESVTPEGIKAIYKDFNDAGAPLVEKLRAFRNAGVHVLGSFIFGLPTDNPSTFDMTAELAQEAGITFAQFVMLTPFPGTVDFARWEAGFDGKPDKIAGIPVTRHWLIPQQHRPKVYSKHPTMSAEEIRSRTQAVWDKFYSLQLIWRRSRCVRSLRARLAFVLISKLYRQMYANTGITSDSARVARSSNWARWIAKPCVRLFTAPMET